MFSIFPDPSWLIGIPLLSAIQFLFTYSANLFIATVNLFFRDLERLIQICMTFLFYFTPVVYDIEMVPEKFRHLIVLNPVAPIIICWRDLFLKGEINWYYLSFATTWSILAFIVAHFTYKKLSWRFAKIL